MHDGRIARVEPTTLQGSGCRFRVVVVALHDHIPTSDNFTKALSIAWNLVPIRIDNAQLAGGDQFDPLARFDSGPLVGRQLLVGGPGLAHREKR